MHGTTIRLETMRERGRLLEIVEDWRALAAAAGEPNIFMEPMAALPALDYPDTDKVFAVAAWGADASGKRRLDGLLLLKPWKRSRFLPAAVQSWNYRLRAYGEPLIRSGREHAFWAAVLPHLDELPGFSVLRLAQLRDDSASTVALRELAAELRRPLYETRRFERAMLRGPTCAETYVERLPTKLLREQKRRRRRLEELGAVRFERLRPGKDAAQWIEALIALEAAGWKGRRGVAAASEPHVEQMVRHLLAEAHRSGRLDMRRLLLGERTISMIAHIESGRTAMSFKIAYDEEFARYSPGVLLQMDYLERGLSLDWVDSCASPGHPMFDTLWLERRPIVTLMIPFARPGARIACAAENAVRLASQRWKGKSPGDSGAQPC
jgi:CelD/BcsL family acetyltransferase involved in cellulose biosynthesis